MVSWGLQILNAALFVETQPFSPSFLPVNQVKSVQSNDVYNVLTKSRLKQREEWGLSDAFSYILSTRRQTADKAFSYVLQMSLKS